MLTMLFYGCNTLRYVPADKYLLTKNELQFKNVSDIPYSEKLDEDEIAEYIKQRPNRNILGIELPLGLYSITDSSRHDWWHNLWNKKFGSPPVIYDSTLTDESVREMKIFLGAKGYLNAEVTDSLVVKQRKATVIYKINQGEPYKISYIDYNYQDPMIAEVLRGDSIHSLIQRGRIFDLSLLQNERTRITNVLRNQGYYSFGSNYINYTADSAWNDNTVSIQLNLNQRVAGYTTKDQPVMENHPIYRISRIVVNSDFNTTLSEQNSRKVVYDTTEYQGIEILYDQKMYIRPDILVGAIGMSPYSLYDQTAIQRTLDNVRALGYTTNIVFNPVAVADSLAEPTIVTLASADGKNVSTTELQMECTIQCTPIKRQAFTAEFEVSSTAEYFSTALVLGYQNRNLFGGAENFNINFRGAYEFSKNKGRNNSYEFGVTTSLAIPRFLLPMRLEKQSLVRGANTRLTLSYNIQQRPDYHRTLVSGVFGYGWTMKNGARFQVNPADLNLVYVPWVNQDFLNSITNPFLRNSYQSQLILGGSVSYYRNSNLAHAQPGFTLRAMTDFNGNLISAFNKLITREVTADGETYNTLFGLRYAQYVRASFEYSQRYNATDFLQIAWRFYIGGGVPYGNSSIIPFERLFFAGGSNSMRGWQVRTLGPGSEPENTDSGTTEGGYYYSPANQLGDFRLEANVEFRQKLFGGLHLAVFFDAGNIWMNSKGRKSNESLFQFDSFYRQLALNTGAGLRWDFDILLIRLDWGLKLYNPALPRGQGWFKNLALDDTAIHFAIGLPF